MQVILWKLLRNMIETSKRELENYLEINISLLKALSKDDRFSDSETSLIEKGKLLRPYQKNIIFYDWYNRYKRKYFKYI